MQQPIKTIYRTNFTEADVAKAYVCCTIDYQFLVHAVNDKSLTLWTGLFDEIQMQPAIHNAAFDLRGHAFNQVEIGRDNPLWGTWHA